MNITNVSLNIAKRVLPKAKSFLPFLLLLPLSCLFVLTLFAQNNNKHPFVDTSASHSKYLANVQHFGVAKGLSHRDVFYTFQDSKGFIWIGTRYGLNRFDGHNFRLFTKEKQGLASNRVNQIFEDASGWLWVIEKFYTGLTHISFINIHTLEVKSIEERFGQNEFPLEPKQIYRALNSPDGTIFLGTTEGTICRFHPSYGFKSYPVKGALQIGPMYFSRQKTIKGKNRKSDGRLEYLELDTLGNVLNKQEGKNITPIGEDKSGRSWYYEIPTIEHETDITFYSSSKNNGLSAIDVSSISIPGGWKSYSGYSEFYYRDFDQTFWLKDNQRLLVFHPLLGLLYDFGQDYPEVIENEIRHLFFDNRQNIWVATGNGVFKVQLKSSRFQHYLSISPKKYNINAAFSSRAMLVKDDLLWINTQSKGQYLINLKSEDYFGVQQDITFRNRKGEISDSPLLLPATELQNGQLLFGGDDHLTTFDLQNQSHHSYYWRKGHAPSQVWSVFEDSRLRVWCGLRGFGLGFLDPLQDSVQSYSQYNQFRSLAESTIYSFLEWDDKHLLMGSSSGIYLLHKDLGIIDRYWTEGEGLHYFPHNLIHHLHRDKQDPEVIWVSSGGGGLIRWDTNLESSIKQDNKSNSGNSMLQFTIADGLPSNALHAVYEDDKNNLWIPSEYGLIRFNKQTHQNRTFLEQDGISHNEFNRISHYQDSSGRLYFGGLNGITSFHPEELENGSILTTNAPLVILGFQQLNGAKNNIEDRTTDLLEEPKIILRPGDDFFRLDFALLEYEDTDQVRYAYQLEGQSDNWSIIKENTLRISGLAYGTYTLHIRGRKANGEFAKEKLEIPIHVLKPFYLQTWFMLMAMFVILTGLFLFYKQRTRKLRQRQKELESEVTKATQTILKQNEELKSLDQVKTRFFANVSHELRTPLTLILGPLSTLIKGRSLNNKDRSLAELGRKNARSLLLLVNEILDLTKMEFGKTELYEEVFELYPSLKLVVGNFEGISQERNIHYLFNYKAKPNLEIIADSRKMTKIVNNLLSNAFKFTSANGKVLVEVEETEDLIRLSVIDSGRGIHPDDLPYVFDRFYQSSQASAPKEGGTGIGLSLSLEFAKLMQGKLWAESSLGKGSTFIFEFPKRVSNTDELSLGEETDTVLQSLSEVVFQQNLPQPTHSKDSVTDKSKANIVLIEDNEGLREYIQLIIGERYQIQSFENGKIAWEHLHGLAEKTEDLPQLIISDIMMPEMDGYQLLEKIKATEQLRGIPVIMLTALAKLKDKLKALRIGVDDYIVKPFEEEELIARIDNLLRNNQERDAFYQQQALPVSKKPERQAISESDHQWLKELEEVVENNVPNFNFTAIQLAYDLAMSKRALELKIKSLTGLSPRKYIQEVRFNTARDLLEKGVIRSVKVVTGKIGIKDTSHFSKLYKQRFGCLPSDYF